MRPNGLKLSPQPSDEEMIASFRRIRREHRDPYTRWLMMIKELRVMHHCTILEAERIAFSNPHLRNWVNRAINTGNPARKKALYHIRYNGADSLIERLGDSFDFRIPPP